MDQSKIFLVLHYISFYLKLICMHKLITALDIFCFIRYADKNSISTEKKPSELNRIEMMLYL